VRGDSAASEQFVKGLAIRGEAVEPDADGKLPPAATHAIVKNPDGTVSVKRARYKLF
jgi:hypothetical protein